MVNISKRKLKSKIHDNVVGQLVHHVARVRGDIQTKAFLSELLTEAEHMQLAKRLSIVLLLLRGYSFPQIGSLLHVSPTTVVKLWIDLKKGKFKTITRMDMFGGKAFRKDTTLESFIQLLTHGLPPRAGKGRWKFLKEF